jgi:cytochrome c553
MGRVWIGAGLALLLLTACQGKMAQQSASNETAPAMEKPAVEGQVAQAAMAQETPAERGKYLVTAIGCNDCHTPLKMGPNGPEPDMSRMLSGHPEGEKLPAPPKMTNGWMMAAAGSMTAFAGPWGISYPANLTPDPSGLGAWTADQFIKTMRTGKHWGQSRAILPPMPWQGIGKLSDNDLRAIFAYLQSIPPVSNHVPDPVPPPAAPGAAGS